jgi:Glycosyltransferase 61
LSVGEEIEVESTHIKSTIICDENSIDDGFPYARPTICEMIGEITVHPISSLVTIISSLDQGYGEKKIRPYARKDDYLLPKVKEITLKPVFTESEVPQCTITHTVPAVIFSVSGYTGNFFHDMADVLIPLFLTSYQFNSEVQFFVTNYDQKWIQKYRPILERLSRYNIVNLDRDKNVHCVKHAILGLFRDRDLIIHPHPTRNPKKYSMSDFTKFLRQVYALKRGTPVMLGELLQKRPRMLIISRKGTRRISNLRELVRMTKELGFEVVVSEAGGDVKRYAQLVNSCDVMLAVHGAGLTNQIFLPPKAVVIQVVPWGKMDWMATNFYGQPAIEMDLKYLEYSVKEDESSLIRRYPRDHVVFKDPYSIHLKGWEALSSVIMSQNVKLNLRRFRETLLTALELLQE